MNSIALSAIAWMRRFVDGFLVVAFLAMFGAVLLQVFVRSFTTYTVVGTEEIANYAQLWLVLIGAGVAIRMARHVAVDILVAFLPPKVRLAISLVNALAILWFLAVLFEGALPLVDMGMFQTSPALGLPMWTMYSSLLAGAVYMAIELVLSLFPAMQVKPPAEPVSAVE